jgi:antitoxin component YwqK of YwqJK toxin-antitoxin module
MSFCYAQNQEKTVVTLENGQFEEYVVGNNGQTSFALYSQDGVLMETGFFAKKERDGQWSTYNAAGNKTAEMQYNKGNKDGDMFIWNEFGTLLYKIVYEDGVRKHAYYYANSGEVIAQRD